MESLIEVEDFPGRQVFSRIFLKNGKDYLWMIWILFVLIRVSRFSRLLHQAALWDNAELLEDLLHGEELGCLDARDSWGRTALHAAATNLDSQCLRILCQVCNSNGFLGQPLLKFPRASA